MKEKLYILLGFIIFAGLTLLLSIAIEKTRIVSEEQSTKKKSGETIEEKSKDRKASGAMESMQWISEVRAYPEADIPKDKFYKAFEYSRDELQALNQKDGLGEWRSMGPNNIGGRSLCLAVHPVDTNIIFMGSASGGLWKSTTGGIGASAWSLVNTGFPSSAVSSIAIDSSNPNVMYIGTGENYGYQYSENGVDVRVTRGMYGIGILKTTNAGQSWSKSLDWSYNSKSGIWNVIINSKNSNVLYASTSEGVYRSNDAGGSWSQVLNVRMVMDLELNQTDTSTLFASVGNLTNNVPLAEKGIFRSTNGGANWTKLSGGLPANWSGKATLELYKGNMNFVYASIPNDFSYVGYFKSTNAGNNWTQFSTAVPIGNQGWYNNGHIVKSNDPNTILVGTINVEKSVNGGSSFTTKSDWSAWIEGPTPAGEPEGPPNFVHADVHYYTENPKDPEKIYVITDGGLYRSNNYGEDFFSCNGSYVTTQFYASFANSFQDSVFCLGGMQDNRSAFFEGTSSWYKTFYGDGMSCAINSQNDNTCYTEYVSGAINKSTDRGVSWFGINPPGSGNGNNYCFVAPFILCRSNPQVMYVGGLSVYKSTVGGGSWQGPYGTGVFGGSRILSMAGSSTGVDTLYCGNTAGKIFRSVNAGLNWTNITSAAMPVRYATDMHVSDRNSAEAFVTFGGFGSPHVYRTTDAGSTWSDITGNLPDVPCHSIINDPVYQQNIYVGNDLGVYVTTNGGISWNEYMTGMPYSLIFDLSIVYPNRSIRAATHGNGIYERKLLQNPVNITGSSSDIAEGYVLYQNFPNPFNPSTRIVYDIVNASEISLKVFDVLGREVAVVAGGMKNAGRHEVQFNAADLPGGVYFSSLYADGKSVGVRKMLLLK